METISSCCFLVNVEWLLIETLNCSFRGWVSKNVLWKKKLNETCIHLKLTEYNFKMNFLANFTDGY